ATAGARPHLPVRRRAGVCGSEIIYLLTRNDARLPGDPDAAGVCLRQPERHQVLRLRNVILRVIVCGAGALARDLRNAVSVRRYLFPESYNAPDWFAGEGARATNDF